MASADKRTSKEIARLHAATRRSLWLAAAGILLVAGLLLPGGWLFSGQLLSAAAERASFQLTSRRGDVTVQQVVAPGPDEFHLYFTVQSPEGVPIRSLQPEDLSLTADEIGPVLSFELMPAAQDPLTLFVAVDTGAPMGVDGRLTGVREHLGTWFHTLAVRQAALISFAAQPRMEEELTSDEGRFFRALDRLTAGGETALNDAVVYAADRAAARESRMALMLVTEGVDTASKARLNDAWSRARASTLPVFAIGLGDSPGQAALAELARKTGGRALRATNTAALPAALASVSDLLSAQFRLGVPSILPRPSAGVIRVVGTIALAALLLVLYVASVRWLLAPRIVLLGGPQHGTAVPLTSEILVCGSDPGCHLQVPGELRTTAGRRFALERRGDAISFHLLDPSGATTVNRALVESRDLVSGDLLRAGLARFLFFRYDPSGADELASEASSGASTARVSGTCWIVSDDGGPAFKIEGERVRVGREPDNEIVLEDPSVSRRHAEFVATPEGLSIADLGSRNGTYLGRSRVGSESAIHAGARLRFGRLKFTVSATPPGEDLFELGDSDSDEREAAAAAEPSSAATEEVPQPVPAEPATAPEPAEDAAPPAPSPAARAMPAEPAPSPAEPESERGCPVCNHMNRAGARYCTQCGEKLAGEQA